MRWPFADRFRRLAANASGLVGTRLALFSLELQEELERQIARFALLLAVFMCSALSLLFVSVLALVFAWQHGHLLATAGGLALVCAALALASAFCLRRSLRTAPQPFSETLAEFKRDEASLRGPAAREEAPEREHLP
jgi:uncharacterized membrane protein YqjE